LTFGKGSRLGELFVGSLVLGGTSNVGNVPDGVSGSVGIGVSVLCLVVGCWLGVRTGQQTVSPTLNTWWKASIISIIQFLFVAVAVSVVGVLRTSATIVFTQVTNVGVHEVALVSLLSLGYLLTVNRTSEPTAEQRDARKRLTEIHKEMKMMREQENPTPDSERMIENLRDVAEKIPQSQFKDVDELKSKLEQVADSIERIDYDSRDEIITGNIQSETHRADSYQEALVIYNSAYKSISKVKRNVRIH
jgi:hypothetical protein